MLIGEYYFISVVNCAYSKGVNIVMSTTRISTADAWRQPACSNIPFRPTCPCSFAPFGQQPPHPAHSHTQNGQGGEVNTLP